MCIFCMQNVKQIFADLWLKNSGSIPRNACVAGRTDRQTDGRTDYGQSDPYGCSSVILLRPKIGVEPPKHDVISMPTQQYTNTNYISLERSHLVVSIMLRYMDRIKTFNDNLSCCKVKIDKNFWGDLPYFALKCDKFL